MDKEVYEIMLKELKRLSKENENVPDTNISLAMCEIAKLILKC